MRFYTARRNGVLPGSPNEYYREHEQELINSQWYNTTTLQTIEEECPWGSLEFREIEVHMTHALDKTTNKKQGNDFRELIFRDIDYTVNLGTYYRFSDAYWLTINTEELNLISKNVIVRRCNNVMKWEDESGNIYSYPCILAYDVTAGSPRVDNDVITPNNRIMLIVQANQDTTLLKVNMRFIFGDRPFKIISLNNYMIDEINGVQNILYYQVQLDEILPWDDFDNGIAYNTNTDVEPVQPEYKDGLVVEPLFDCVRQNYTMRFEINRYINNVKQDNAVTAVAGVAPEWAYEFNSLGDNQFSVKCKKVAKTPLEITFTDGELTDSILVDLKSMF